jgi:hypothetical protein
MDKVGTDMTHHQDRTAKTFICPFLLFSCLRSVYLYPPSTILSTDIQTRLKWHTPITDGTVFFLGERDNNRTGDCYAVVKGAAI